MTHSENFDIFLATFPGLESALCAEIRTKGFKQPTLVPGGAIIKGGWPEVWRANLWIRGAGRARCVEWDKVLRPDISFRVEVTCAKSRIYHSDAAADRIEGAIKSTLGARHSPNADIVVMARIERDLCTISVDTSGEPLHKRGYKEAVNQAPLRETMASLFLQQCGYNGNEPVVDPMCGSGTFIIEAAEIAARLNPGRLRHFAFEEFANFDAEAWQRMREVKSARVPTARFYGSDRDKGAITMSRENAERAGVAGYTDFQQCSISDIQPPPGPAGLVIVNPPFGARLGDKKKLFPLYGAMGQTLMSRFKGWRVGIVTTEVALAHATGLPFLPTDAPVQHGGLRVTLFQTKALT